MPKIKSAVKRVKTSEKSHLRNISHKSKIKTTIKKYNLALSEKNKDEAIKYLKDSASILDKAVSKGILPKGNASRRKSRLAKKLNILLKPTQEPETPKIEKIEKEPEVKETTKITPETVVKKISRLTKRVKTKKTTKAVKKTVSPKTKKP